MEAVKAVEEDDDGEEQEAMTLTNTVTNGARKGEYRAAYKAAEKQREKNKNENRRRKKRRILLEAGISSDDEIIETSKRGRAKAVKEDHDQDEVARSNAVSRLAWTQEEHGVGHPISAHDSAESAMEEADEASEGSELMGSSVEEGKRRNNTQKRNETFERRGKRKRSSRVYNQSNAVLERGREGAGNATSGDRTEEARYAHGEGEEESEQEQGAQGRRAAIR